MKSYSDKLKDPRWQKQRLEILNRDEFRCQNCAEDTKTLHVHHRRYLPGREPWDIPNELLVTLCAECHEYEGDEMPSSTHDLVEMVKEKFFAGEVHRIADAFRQLENYRSSEVFSSVIQYWFSNPHKVEQMWDEFFEYLHEKSSAATPF